MSSEKLKREFEKLEIEIKSDIDDARYQNAFMLDGRLINGSKEDEKKRRRLKFVEQILQAQRERWGKATMELIEGIPDDYSVPFYSDEGATTVEENLRPLKEQLKSRAIKILEDGKL